MKKELSEMTLEELWELFPVVLSEHREKWKQYYAEIETFLKNVLSEYPHLRISHIGSTAVDGIKAKSIVDVLVEVSEKTDLESAAKAIEKHGFICMAKEGNGRISFNKGYTKSGFSEKVYHVHLRCQGDNDELYFRDYLNEHPQTAKEYEALKIRLCRKFEHNRDA